MRWNLKDFTQTPELSSDIEWMIQSGQVSRELIVETLADQYYGIVYLLAISLLNDRFAAKTATRETFIRLVLNLHQYRSGVGVKNWVLSTAFRECSKKQRGESVWRYLDSMLSMPGQFTDPLIVQPPTEFDRNLWQRVDELDQMDRILLILRYGNNWEISEIARVIGLDEETIPTRLQSTLEEVITSEEAIPEDAQKILKNSLGLRWRTQAVPDNEVEKFVKQVLHRTGRKRNWRREMSTAKEMVLLGLALLFVILIIWGGNRYLDRAGTELGPSGGLMQELSQEINTDMLSQ